MIKLKNNFVAEFENIFTDSEPTVGTQIVIYHL